MVLFSRDGQNGFMGSHFTFTDPHGVEIWTRVWVAEDPVGVVQISHGVGEHAGRYASFAEKLRAAGLTVYADDHRGHGETGKRQWDGDLSRLGRLGPGGLRATEDAIRQLTALIRERHPNLPVIMFAHSWGSLMAQRILNDHPREWDALVLSGTAHRTLRGLENGKLNARWAADDQTGFAWLSRDLEVARTFLDDPLCFEADILKLFGVADSLRLYGTPAEGLATDVPIHIVSGSDDPLHRGERNLQALADAYRRRGVRDVTVKIYPGSRHELLNELDREDVAADLITWMLDRIGED